MEKSVSFIKALTILFPKIYINYIKIRFERMFHLSGYLGLTGGSVELIQARLKQAQENPLESRVLQEAMNGSARHYVGRGQETINRQVASVETEGIHATIVPFDSDDIVYMNQFLCGRNGWKRETVLEDGADHRGLLVFKSDPSQVKLTLGQEVIKWARHHHRYWDEKGREPPTFTPSLFSEK